MDMNVVDAMRQEAERNNQRLDFLLEHRICVKCGHNEIQLIYVPSRSPIQVQESRSLDQNSEEHLRCTCLKCKFVWTTPCLDYRGVVLP